MRILWIVNMVLPPLSQALKLIPGASGTWMVDIAEKLDADENIDFAVACVHGVQYAKHIIHNTTYFCLPGTGRDMMFYNRGYVNYWEQIMNEFKPDIVNIHGTEYIHALSFVRRFPGFKTVISLQGVLTHLQNYDTGGLTKRQILSNRTWREYIHLNGMFEMHLLHKKNARSEQEMLKTVKYCMAVDSWHESMALLINPQLNVFKVDYNLRNKFYTAGKWNVDTIKRYTITTNPGGTALKGIHQLIKAGALVKKWYPDIKIEVPGMRQDANGLVVNSGYAKYLRKLINKLRMEKNVVFLGYQNEEQMIANMQHSHIQVIPSAIEGPSLILREGMHIGIPTIASFRGGMADFVNDKINGFLFDFEEYQYLALRIKQLFDKDELAKEISVNAIAKAEAAHSRERNYRAYMDMYITMLKD
jgi:L-malate glycosyltransferase